jgi:hypothetical protein
MKEHGSPKNYRHIAEVCDSIFMQKNRLYLIYRTKLIYLETAKKVSIETRDTVFRFVRALTAVQVLIAVN